MENNTLTQVDRRHQIITWALIGGLLFLRLPFLGGIALFAAPQWLTPAFQIGTYLLTAVLIWWERERLADYHIDRLALAIIILFKPVQTLIQAAWNFDRDPLTFPGPSGLSLWAIALGLLVALRLSRAPLPKMSKRSWGWFGLGILGGLAAVLVTAYPLSLQIDESQFYGKPDLFGTLMAPASFLYQLGYAAVTEEPLFRGFLWGALHKAGWKPLWIWLCQAALFTLGHIYYITRAPFSFWFVVPVGALILGGLVWRSKSLSSSLAAHATLNTLGYSAGYFVAYYWG